jgi:hypothetical protein
MPSHRITTTEADTHRVKLYLSTSSILSMGPRMKRRRFVASAPPSRKFVSFSTCAAPTTAILQVMKKHKRHTHTQ